MARWPTVQDFLNAANYGQLGTSQVQGPSQRATEAFNAAYGAIRGVLDDRLLPDQEAVAEDLRCPDQVRMAIIIYAARLQRRPETPFGTVTAGDTVVSIRKTDPDVAELIERFHVPDIV